MSRNITFAPGEFYHIYNRGTEKIKTFRTEINYRRFIALLYLANSSLPVPTIFRDTRGRTSWDLFNFRREETLVDICAYCLMPNHFHLIVKEKEDGGLSKFMQKLITAYTMYFNTLHNRNGALFQGKFKATHVDNDKYLSYLIAYLHLNPVKLIDSKWKKNGIRNKRKTEQFLNHYSYSSFIDYCGLDRIEKVILVLDVLPKYTETPKDFKDSITQWLDYPHEVEPRGI